MSEFIQASNDVIINMNHVTSVQRNPDDDDFVDFWDIAGKRVSVCVSFDEVLKWIFETKK